MDPNQPNISEETLAVTPPTPPGRRRSRWAWVLLAIFVGVSGAAYAAVSLSGSPSSKSPTSGTNQPPASPLTSSEQGKLKDVSTGPTLLQVTQLISESANLGAAIATSLQVSGAVSLQTNLAVTGNGSFGGVVTAANFQGGGGGLTGVNAALLNGQPGSYYAGLAGNVDNLSANAALRNAPNTFTAGNAFNGAVTISGPASLTGTTTISSLILGSPLTTDQGGTGLSTIPVNGVLYGQGGPTLGVATPASAGQCLVSTSTAVQWGSCSGSTGGVDSLNGLAGVLTLANATGVGSTVTIDNASTSAKGIAQFGATNFSVVSGVVNTVQNISTTGTPSFAGLILGAPLAVTSGGTGAGTLTSNGIVIGQGTGALTTVTAGAAGECLVSTVGAPTFQSCPGASGVLSVNSQTGAVAIANATGSGGTITIDDATTTSKGIAQFSATNFSVGAGSVNTIQNISTTSSPAFAALTLSGTLNANTITPNATATIGATGQSITLQGSTTTITSTNGSNLAALTFAAPSSNVTYILQTAAAGTYDVCTTAGNCVGSGGGVTSPGGTLNHLAKFSASTTLANSILTDDGTTVTIGGNLSVTGGVSLTSALTVANGGTGAQTLAANGVVIGQGTGALTVVTAAGAGECFVSTAGAPTFQSCPGASGVASLNGQNGTVSINNATGSGGAITIDDASTASKGIASFNSTNFTATGGAVNTIQNIGTTANPTFGNATLSTLTVTSSQATSPLIFANNTNGSGTGNLIDLRSANTSRFSVAPSGDTIVGGTLTAGAATFSSVTTNTITPTASATIGSTSQNLTLQGAGTTITSTSGANTTTLSFVGPTANVTYQLQTAAAGTYDICTTVGNCSGVGGGVTSPGGTLNHLAKFSAGTTIADSIITDNGSTVTVGGTLSVNTLTPTAALTIGATGQNTTVQGATVALKANAGGITNTLTFATPSGSNKTITVPDATGTVAVSAAGPLALDSFGNLTCPTCLTSGGGGGGTAGVASLNTATGALTLQGASAGSVSTAGTVITINDASSSVKGLASFNTTNLTVVSGAVNTVQDIAVGSTPTFAGLNLTAALSLANGGTGGTSAATARTSLVAAKSGANSDITSLTGLTTPLSIAQGGTGVATTPTNGQILIGNGSGFSLNTLTAGTGVTITNTSGVVTIAAPGSGSCASCANTALSNLSGVAINTSLLPGSAAGANLGSGTLPFGQLALAGSSASPATNNFLVTGTSTGGTRTINLPDASGTVAVSASGYLSLNSTTGALTFTGPLAVADGGTGANNPTSARSNLSAAKSGANTDITSLGGLTTALSVGQGGIGTNTLTANGVLFGNGSSAISAVTGSTGQCLVATATSPIFQTCPGSGGVASVNGATGALVIQGASAGSLTTAGTTITINDASGTLKGLASFNTTNFTVTSGVVNTVQDIAVASTPTFGGLTVSGTATVGSLLTTSIDTPTCCSSTLHIGASAGNGISLDQYVTTDGALSVNDGAGVSSGAALYVRGAEYLSNINSSNNATYTTEDGGTFKVGLGIEPGDPGYQNATMALQVTSVANANSFGILAFDNRATTHLPTIAVVSADENQNIGLNWNGSSTTSYVQTSVNNMSLQVNNLNALNLTNSSGTAVATLGVAGSNAGQLVFANGSNSNTVTLQSGTTTGSYALSLPTAAPGTSQCLQSGAVTATQLTFGSCGSGITLQAAYTSSVGSTTPEIKVDSTRLGLDIQDANTTIGTTQNLLAVRAANGSGLGSLLFGVTTQGYVTLQPTTDATSVFSIKNATGTSQLAFDTTNGRLGIGLGATAPGYALDIATGSTNDGLRISTTNSSADLLDIQGPSYSYFDVNNNGHVSIRPRVDGTGVVDVRDTTGNFSIFSVDTANGRVGVNNSVPDAGLQVSPSGPAEIALQVSGKTSQSADLVRVTEIGGINLFKVGATGASVFQNSADSTSAFQIQNLAGTPLFTADTSGMKVTVQNLVVTANLTVNGHIISGGSTPSLGAGIAACTSPTLSITGTDTAGLITVTTGSTGCTPGKVLAATFATAFGAAPQVVITPANAITVSSTAFINSANTTASLFELDVQAAIGASTTYKWYYHVIQ